MKWLFLGIGSVIGAAAGFTAACLLHKRCEDLYCDRCDFTGHFPNMSAKPSSFIIRQSRTRWSTRMTRS